MSELLGSLAASALLTFFGTFSQSSNYRLQNYNLGSGGTNSASSSTYKLNASTGEVGGATTSSTNRKILPSSIQAQQANVPLAPTLGNGSGTYYNQLSFVINKGGTDPSDYTYAVAVSTDNFATTKYVQADGTLNTSQVYQSYATWGGFSGSLITGLTQSTNYQVKVAAKQDLYTNSAFGPQASMTTAGPQLTFGLNISTINMGNLTAGSVITSASPILVTFATNAVSGGNVYVAGLNSGLKSTANNTTISSVSNDLSVLSEGFGLQVSSSSQTSGGPFTKVSPFNGSSNNVGAADATFKPILASGASVVGGNGLVFIKAKASSTTPAAGDYREVLTFVASASF